VFSKNRDRLLEGDIAAKFLAAVLTSLEIRSAMPFSVPLYGYLLRMGIYFELSNGSTNLRPLGPVPLTCRTVSSLISMKCGTLAGSV
jgi:hypothetical protein